MFFWTFDMKDSFAKNVAATGTDSYYDITNSWFLQLCVWESRASGQEGIDSLSSKMWLFENISKLASTCTQMFILSLNNSIILDGNVYSSYLTRHILLNWWHLNVLWSFHDVLAMATGPIRRTKTCARARNTLQARNNTSTDSLPRRAVL